jgi:hypothetical protein
VTRNLLKLPETFLHLWLPGSSVLNLQCSDIPVASVSKFIQKLTEHPSLSALHLPTKTLENATNSEALQLLKVIDGVVDTLPNLTFLGIQGLKLRPLHLPVLTSIFRALRGKL